MPTFEQLIQRYPADTFKKGQTLLLKDQIPRAVFFIEKGKVRAYTITADGAERQITLHGAGDDVPVGFGFGLVDSAEYFYEAYSDCTVRMIPRDVFARHFKADTDGMYQRYVHLDELFMGSLARLNAVEHPKAGDKVAFMLLELAKEIGVRLRPSKNNLKLHLTQQELANTLGLTRETTAIELKKLEVKRILTHTRKNYILSIERLREYLEKR